MQTKIKLPRANIPEMEKTIRFYNELGGCRGNKEIQDQGGHKNDTMINKVNEFLLFIGILEKCPGRKQQLTHAGSQLARALANNNKDDARICWRKIIAEHQSMRELLQDIKQLSPLDPVSLRKRIIKMHGTAKYAHDNTSGAKRIIEILQMSGLLLLDPNRNKYVVNDELLLQAISKPSPIIPYPSLKITSEVVEQAIRDAEELILSEGAPSGVDRMHTVLHGYLKTVCKTQGIQFPARAEVSELFALLRDNHPALQSTALGIKANEVTKILRAISKIIDALNPIRDRATLVHPNETLKQNESMLAIHAILTLLHYLNAKL